MLPWLLSPPMFVVLATVGWLRARQSGVPQRTHLAIGIGILTIINWIVFAIFLSKAKTPYGETFQTSVLTQALLFLCLPAAAASHLLLKSEWRLFFANLLLMSLWIGIAYAPSHFLKRWNYGDLTIDGRKTPASIFIAHPWDSEAEDIVLVQTSTTEDFFLSFGQEGVHVSPKARCIRVPGGVWAFASLREMAFDKPLFSTQMNEFRFRSRDGRIVSVQF